MTVDELIEEGTCSVAVGDFDQAIQYFKQATEMQADHFEAWHSLGLACMKAERYPEAVAAGIRAVELNPTDQMARVSLSMFFQRNGQIPEAEAEAGKAKIISWGGKLLPSQPGQVAPPGSISS